jgi:hypothetical protein
LFSNEYGYNPCEPDSGSFRAATVTGRLWRTLSGLRIGHPKRLILRYHPRARRAPDGSNWWWLLTRRSSFGEGDLYPALRAKVQNGRVTAFAVYYDSEGE